MKFRKSCPLNGGPLSLPQTEVFSAMRICGQALVLLRGTYSPLLMGPQKSVATSLQGSLGNGDICSGSCSFAGVTT